MNPDHNHFISKATFAHHPSQRKLSQECEKEVENLLKLKSNKKLVQKHISSKTGKIVLLKDLTNIAGRCKDSTTKVADSKLLQEVYDFLKEKAGSTVEVAIDENSHLLAIYYQDKSMKTMFAAFPEIIIADATYKLNNLRMPLFILMCIDGNGLSEIAAVFLLASEGHDTLQQMLSCFKKYNPSWMNIVTIITDKDMTERAVFKEEIPNAELQLCVYHVQKSFRRQVTLEKMALKAAQRDLALEVLRNIMYSKSEDEYNKNYEKLLNLGNVFESVVNYYNSNWHPIREQWVIGFKCMVFNMRALTTNHLESFNQKIKSVCSRYADLLTFFEEFTTLLSVLRNERDAKAASMYMKQRVHTLNLQHPQKMYHEFLTEYAYSLVEEQLEMTDKVKILDHLTTNSCLVKMSTGEFEVLTTNCSCSFRCCHRLPCRHILAVRRYKEMDMIDSQLCDLRWTRQHYGTNHRILQSRCTLEVCESSLNEVDGAELPINSDNNNTPLNIIQIASSKKRKLSELEKYKQSFELNQQLSTLISEVSSDRYSKRMDFLKMLKSYWEKGIDPTGFQLSAAVKS